MKKRLKILAGTSSAIVTFIFSQVMAYADTSGGMVEVDEDGTWHSKHPEESMVGYFSSIFNEFFSRYRFLISGITGICAMAVLVMLIFHIVQFAGSGSKPASRSKAIRELLTCSIAFVILGSISFFVGVFYNLFRS